MERGRTKLPTAALLLFLLSIPAAVEGKDLFASLDFARKSLISYRKSSFAANSSASVNGFLQALGDVERAVARKSAETIRPNYSAAKLSELASHIKKANAGRNVGLGRSLLGEAL